MGFIQKHWLNDERLRELSADFDVELIGFDEQPRSLSPSALRQDAARLAAGPTVAYRYMKENLNRAMTGDLYDCLDLEVTHHIHCGQTEDHREATNAFVAKREPVFHGR